MAFNRSIRSLALLSGASSSRVLNLSAIALAQRDNPDHRSAPLFGSPVLNSSIIVKHRLRPDETDIFQNYRALATKIIVPFEKADLEVGGRSLFVGERRYEALLLEVGKYGDKHNFDRDLEILRLIDSLPSLDPFLLREHLCTKQFAPDSCYFEISNGDQERMYQYAATEIGRLTSLAADGRPDPRDSAGGKMVAALLSSEVNQKLEPLRATLDLGPEEFSEGVFSWRGFIYYKWSLGELWPRLIRTLQEIKATHPSGTVDSEQAAFLGATKNAIIRGVRDNSNEVNRIIAIYDKAYASLIQNHEPKVFREFLLGARALFLETGEKMGAMSHITSFWRFRFPPGSLRKADSDELIALLQDFAQGFEVQPQPQAA